MLRQESMELIIPEKVFVAYMDCPNCGDYHPEDEIEDGKCPTCDNDRPFNRALECPQCHKGNIKNCPLRCKND